MKDNNNLKHVKIKASRRNFLQKGSMGLAGLAGAAALGVQPSTVNAQTSNSDKRRVTILFDSWNHMMPALAREMVRRNHDLVLGDAQDMELVEELRKLGAKVEVAPAYDVSDLTVNAAHRMVFEALGGMAARRRRSQPT